MLHTSQTSRRCFKQQSSAGLQQTLWPAQLLHHSMAGQRAQHCSPSCCQVAQTTLAARPSKLAYMLPAAISGKVAAANSSLTPVAMMTCKRCKQRFTEADNSRSSCRYHPSLYSGGEVAKAIGFVRASDAPEDQLERVVGRKGLMRFWDCCGNEDESAPGCCAGFHLTFDDDLNESKGWQ